MELRHLRYFVAVAEELHFRRAAERLGIQQPPLSTQIHQLEDELGVQLFYRTAKGVTLTEPGESLLDDARRILRQVDQAKVDVGRRARGEAGRLEIGFAGATPFHPLVPAIVQALHSQYPDIILSPKLSNTAKLLADVRGGLCDVAFVRPPLQDSAGLDVQSVIVERMIIGLPSNHSLAGRKAIPLAAIADDLLIVAPRELNPGFYDHVMDSFRRSGSTPTIGCLGPQLAAFVGMVDAGLGVAIVPDSFRIIQPGGVCYLDIEGEQPVSEIALVHRHGDRSASLRNLLAVARQCSAGFPRSTLPS